ncbi:DUF4354 family protein [Asaia sp. HN010]|uniref:DUF4354 family protein n=1 Tax=Asaia sp. HN010 TaxID=3081233 RepID=UPI0038D0BE8A
MLRTHLRFQLVLLGLVLSGCVRSYAEERKTDDSIVLISYERSRGSMYMNGHFFYLKTFNVTMSNMGKRNLGLIGKCFLLTSSKGDTYHVDTVDENMSVESLQGGGIYPGP